MSTSNRALTVEVSTQDLPLHCPSTQSELWAMHPRVFLALHDGKATCPYCGTD